LKNPIKSGFFEDENLATTYTNYNSEIHIYSGNCSVHIRSSSEKSTWISETKHLQSVWHPYKYHYLIL